ncbi:hypothetical protein [Actinoplanes sp. NPDC051851]|uniref:hypothetical protein n=1 Tax=Actinoplanes sp. NPDC051851 TaxID=3154753 RepID=UPI00343E384B
MTMTIEAEPEVLPYAEEAGGPSLVAALPEPERGPEAGPDEETRVLPAGALQLLALAQRTADDHLAAADTHARRIHDDARSYAAEIRAEADRVLADARREAERIVSEGNDRAEHVALQAQRHYEDTVGGLTIKRQALQSQIEALAAFDQEYRQRITSFLQNQLRALWSEEPRVTDVLEFEAAMPGGPVGFFDRD